MLLLHMQYWFLVKQSLDRMAKAFEGTASHRFRPTYALANVGHPS
jgi:hypothetical protein